MSLADHKSTQKKAGCLNKLLAYCGEVTYMALLKYCIYCAPARFLRSLLTL